MAGGWRLEAGTWLRRAREVGDPNVFFGTTVTAPNSVARQHASGFDLRLDMRQRRGWSASAGYTHARVKQFGPITGGLFLEDDYLEIRDGTPFTPDHDQRHGVHGSATYSDEHRRWRISGVIRYQTGTPLEVEEDDIDEILERPGSEVVDVESGRVRPRTIVDVQGGWTFYRGPRTSVSLTAWMTNVFNHTYAFNFGNPFSGTHFGSPRRVGVSLTARFGRNGS
jgi:outer membrane receptor for ferric coprogen and ferric-rhodotorulic acid